MSNTNIATGMIEAEARTGLADAENLEDKFKVAFEAAKDHWMFTGQDEQFNGAIGAVFMHSNDEEKERITAELDSLKVLHAMLSGVPVDLEAVPELENPIGFMTMWKEMH